MEKIKQKITIENALCLFIVLCPILDMLSFIFRNAVGASISPSTFIRPIISVFVAIVIFAKSNFKRENCFSRYYIHYIWNNSFTTISNIKNGDVIQQYHS